MLTLLYGDIFKKIRLVEFVDGWRFKCTKLHHNYNAASQHWTCTFQSDVLPRCWQDLLYTWSIWFERCSHISDAYIIASGLSTLHVASALCRISVHDWSDVALSCMMLCNRSGIALPWICTQCAFICCAILIFLTKLFATSYMYWEIFFQIIVSKCICCWQSDNCHRWQVGNSYKQCSKWDGMRWELTVLPWPLSWIWGGPQGWEMRERRRTGEEVRGRKGNDMGKERGGRKGTIPVFRRSRVNNF